MRTVPFFILLFLFFPLARIYANPAESVYQLSSAPSPFSKEPAQIIVLDRVGSPGKAVILKAKVQRLQKKIFRSISNTTVEFLIDGAVIGAAQTDKQGMAKVNFVPENYGSYLISARLGQTELFRAATGYGLLLLPSPSEPIVVVDFDSALYQGLSGKFQLVGIERLIPLEGAPPVLNALTEKVQLIYFTDWEISALPKIRQWIAYWKLPKIPVLFWDQGEKLLKDSDWKSQQLAKLLKEWRNVKTGIGGSSDVMRAFRENKLQAIPLRSSYLQEPGALKNWKEVQEALDK